MNELRMSQASNGELSASTGETETMVWNRCEYQVPPMVGTNNSTNKNHTFYNSTVHQI